MRWDQDKLEAYLAKAAKWQGGDMLNDTEQPDNGKEARLQRKCERWLRDRGFPHFHDRSKKQNKAGWFDLTVLLPEGRVVFIELKGKTGKLRKEQQQLYRMAAYLKHEVHVIRSFKAFVQAMEGKP